MPIEYAWVRVQRIGKRKQEWFKARIYADADSGVGSLQCLKAKYCMTFWHFTVTNDAKLKVFKVEFML